MNIMALVNSIESIKLEDGTIVENRGHLKEFISNCERRVYDNIKDLVAAEAAKVKLDPIALSCTSCNHQYNTELNFDQANFFG